MKTRNKRIEDLESVGGEKKNFIALFQDYDNEEIYSFENIETGKKETITRKEAEERFKDYIVIYVNLARTETTK